MRGRAPHLDIIFLMDVLVVSANGVSLPFPVMPAGACLVAEAAERAGHRVRFLDLMFEENPASALQSELKRFCPDVIGLSVRNIDNNDMQNPAMPARGAAFLMGVISRHSRAPVVLGGAAVGVMPEEMLRLTGADCAVVGEGEEVFPAMLERLSSGDSFEGLPGVALIDRNAGGDGMFRKNTEAAPACKECIAPDFGRWIDMGRYLAAGAAAPLQTKLGCHFRCVYCTYRRVEGTGYRLFEPESAAEAVARYLSAGLRDVELVDSVFNSPHGHAMEVCEAIGRFGGRPGKKRARLQTVELNPLFIDDELFGAMEHAGFAGVGITAESASDRVLEGLGKGFSASHVRRAAEVVKRHNIPCLWIFLLGGPGETKETVEETIGFAQKHIRPEDAAFFNIGVRIYPGTRLEEIARQEGLLSLSSRDMVEPVFYISPGADFRWMIGRVKQAVSNNLNFMDSGSIRLGLLPWIHRIGRGFGLRTPLWRHTRLIRRGLRLVGMDA
jgi:radical SAM superfamily enzyme YgiQ (UPF0313 family)